MKVLSDPEPSNLSKLGTVLTANSEGRRTAAHAQPKSVQLQRASQCSLSTNLHGTRFHSRATRSKRQAQDLIYKLLSIVARTSQGLHISQPNLRRPEGTLRRA